jgi:hypothetical protein
MPNLCIIPARALRDKTLKPAHLRVLLAVSIYTRPGGRGAYPSTRTIGADARVGRTTAFTALNDLVAKGYLRRTHRWTEEGRQTSNLYEVVMDDPQGEGPVATEREGPVQSEPSGVQSGVNPLNDLGKNDNNIQGANHQALVDAIDSLLAVYPPTKHMPDFKVLIKPMRAALAKVPLATILRGAEGYARECHRDGTDPKYVTSPQRWLADERWTQYDVPRIYGRTRQDWARSGQDVAEFDRLWAALTNQDGEESDVAGEQYQAL